MKKFFTLLGTTFFLGTAISLHFGAHALFYLPLYAVAFFHIYRLNLSEGFFLVFLSKIEKEEIAKVRLGSSEIGMKDDGDRDEDKFLSFFDWKKSSVRKILSWSVFCATIYLLFFRLHVDISSETIFPAVMALLLMRVVAIGHFLVPLAMNFLFVVKDIPDYHSTEWIAVTTYGILLILCLALIHPSEERILRKFREWPVGKVRELLRTMAILLFSFVTGLFIFPEKSQTNLNPEIPQLDIDRSAKNLKNLNSSLENLMRTGLMKKSSLNDQLESLKEDVKEFQKKESRSPEEWKSLKERENLLTQEYSEKLQTSPTPTLTPELLQMMKNDLKSRSEKGISPETYKKMEDLLSRMNNYRGGSGDDLISDYRDLKFGKGGYYNEETEMDLGPGTDQASTDILKKMSEAAMKKKEVSAVLDSNIEKLKVSPDKGLEAVNDALKKEINDVDTLSELESKAASQEIQRSLQELSSLQKKTTDPETLKKLSDLMEDQQRLKNQLTPHMRAQEKTDFAKKLSGQEEKLTSLRREVRDEVTEDVAAREEAFMKREEESEKSESVFFKKVLRMAIIASGAILLLWFFSLFKKKGIKKVRGIPDEVIEEIRNSLVDVRKKNLSPREEVIETYNVLHSGLQHLVFVQETPPSCIVYEGLSAAEPALKAPTFSVTDIYAKTFYGERDVSPVDLKEFRRGVSSVFTYFGIQG